MKRYWPLYCLLVLTACGNRRETLFESLAPERTGIAFENRPASPHGLNFLDYLYYYNGGGVAAGDINNDGLIDLYFTANNKGGNRLYLNRGDFRFEDITAQAGVAGSAEWPTGVTMADVNGDGLLDIYVSAVSGKLGLTGRNELYINHGNNRFTEAAADYGLGIQAYSTQAAFFDYDHDGDLDCYLLVQSDHEVDRYADTSLRRKPGKLTGDRLLRNDNNHFNDCTAEAGIYNSPLGYGLGLSVADIDGDGWEDIYIGNDFHENDYYYHNEGNGRFTESGAQRFNHYSRFSMGNDIADINNDGEPDLFTADMLPEEEKFSKTYSAGESLDLYRFFIQRNGYQNQYSRNALQLNLGKAKAFSDQALQYGVAATDWSWSPLLADFDNDGWKDLFISNGIRHRPVDLDYMRFLSNQLIQKNINQGRLLDSQALARMPDGAAINYFFRNNRGEHFDDQSREAGFDQPDYSSGAVYADLDNDGRLDLVVNNSFAPASVYRNRGKQGHWLELRLADTASANQWGIGARISIIQDGLQQYQQLMSTRGFQSSVAPVIHAGLPRGDSLLTIHIRWPDQTLQTLSRIKPDQALTIYKSGEAPPPDAAVISPPLFTEVTDSIRNDWRHRENDFVDFNVQRLIPHQLSDRGPALAVADVNGDGQSDIYAGGAAGQQGILLLSQPGGGWKPAGLPPRKNLQADETAALFADWNGDGRPDLLIASGGNQLWPGDSSLNDRLLLQNEAGRFIPSTGWPALAQNKSVLVTADIDNDGDLDVFAGVIADARQYGRAMTSYLLLNNGKGEFSIAGQQYMPLHDLGMVTSAAFGDLNGDGKTDLVVAGEWMPLQVFINKGDHFEKTSVANSAGWWQYLAVADADGDGDMDVFAGNYGLNSKLRASTAHPLRLYGKDIDGNGQADLLLSYSNAAGEYPFMGKDELEMQLPSLKKTFLDYRSFAGKTIPEIFGSQLAQAPVLEVHTLGSSLFRNNGRGELLQELLPAAMQKAPMFALLPVDLDNDGLTDLLGAGNMFGVSPYEGRYDASWGEVLMSKGRGNYQWLSPVNTGFQLRGQYRGLQRLHTPNGEYLVAAENNGPLHFFRFVNTPGK